MNIHRGRQRQSSTIAVTKMFYAVKGGHQPGARDSMWEIFLACCYWGGGPAPCIAKPAISRTELGIHARVCAPRARPFLGRAGMAVFRILRYGDLCAGPAFTKSAELETFAEFETDLH